MVLGTLQQFVDEGIGVYSCTFTNAMPDTNYSVTISSTSPASGYYPALYALYTDKVTWTVSNSSGTYLDASTVCIQIVR